VGPDGKGKAIVNLVSMLPDEKIAALLAVKESRRAVRRDGNAPRRGQEDGTGGVPQSETAGIIAMGIEENDAVIAAQTSDGQQEVFIGTQDGMAIRFPESDVRATGAGPTVSVASRSGRGTQSSPWRS